MGNRCTFLWKPIEALFLAFFFDPRSSAENSILCTLEGLIPIWKLAVQLTKAAMVVNFDHRAILLVDFCSHIWINANILHVIEEIPFLSRYLFVHSSDWENE